MFLMGLNKSFTRGYVWICAIADHGGYRLGRIPGWPRLVQCNEKNKAVAERFAPYFDACNFAARVKCPVRLYACGRDTAVTPECVYAVYNPLATSDKSVVDFPYGRHECYLDQYYKWIKELQADWGIR